MGRARVCQEEESATFADRNKDGVRRATGASPRKMEAGLSRIRALRSSVQQWQGRSVAVPAARVKRRHARASP